MSGRDHLLKLAGIYGQHLGIPTTTVSWRLFQDTNKLEGIEKGRDLYLGRFERAMQYLSDNWPVDVEWPPSISRPPRTGSAPLSEISDPFSEAADESGAVRC